MRTLLRRFVVGATLAFGSSVAVLGRSEEVKNARIFAGIHFRSATNDGQNLGASVAKYVLSVVAATSTSSPSR